MLPGQGDNLLLPPSVVAQRIDMDQQRIGMLLHGPIKCLLYLRLSAGIHNDDVDADAAAGRHECFGIGCVRVLGIGQDSDDHRLGVQQPQQLDALGSELAVDEADPGHVPAGTVQACRVRRK